jgi:hypothetical protein
MRGFDPRFKDLPDFILGITKEIWEETIPEFAKMWMQDEYAGFDGSPFQPNESRNRLVVGRVP